MPVSAKKLAQLKRQKQCAIGTGSKIAKQGRTIPKIKFIKNSEHYLMIPYYPAFPFNPFNLEEEQWNEDNRYYINSSFETAVGVLEALCKEELQARAENSSDDREEPFGLLELLEEYLDTKLIFDETDPNATGMTWDKVAEFITLRCKDNEFFEDTTVDFTAEINAGITPESKWDDIKKKYKKFENIDEWQIINGKFVSNPWRKTGDKMASFWADFRHPYPIGDYVTNFYGRMFGEYGQKVRLNSEIDEHGNQTFKGMAYHILLMEQDRLKPLLDEFKEKCKTGGEFATLDKKQRSIKKQEITSQAKSWGFSLYNVSRVCMFHSSSETAINSDDLKLYQEKGFKGITSWMCINKDKIDSWNKMKGTSLDKFPSFILYRVETGEPEQVMRLYELATKGQAYNKKLLSNLGVEEEWVADYIDYRDDEKLQSMEALEASVDALRRRADAWLFENYQDAFDQYGIEDFPSDVIGRESTKELIRQLAPNIAEQLEEMYDAEHGTDDTTDGSEISALLAEDSEQFDISGDTVDATEELSDEDIKKQAQAMSTSATELNPLANATTKVEQASGFNIEVPTTPVQQTVEQPVSGESQVDLNDFDLSGLTV